MGRRHLKLFVDTSALLALLDNSDPNHRAAVESWRSIAAADLDTHSYVVVESLALVQRRLGIAAMRDLVDRMLVRLSVGWVGPDLHALGLAAVLAAALRNFTLVDAVSFEYMRRNRIETAFAFDDDFRRAGFQILMTRR